MTDHAVVIAGAGPTGMMLGAELTLAGVDAVIVERRATPELDGSRAGGLYPRSLEVLDQRGVADRFVTDGTKYPFLGFALIMMDVTDFPTRHNYTLGLWQSDIERILADWVTELGVPIIRQREVMGFQQDQDGVDVELSEGGGLRSQYLVGCDGGRSAVRKAAGIDFVGVEATTSWMVAEVELDEEPEFGVRRDSAGTHAMNRRLEGEPIRVVITERELHLGTEPGLEDLREALIGVYGTDFGLRRAGWISRFTDMARQAQPYRRSRVLLAGDAAHVHSPHGGQGLNTGLQDAVNLGWKLARVVSGASPDALLDTYEQERHPVAARVLQNTLAQVALSANDARHEAVRDILRGLLAMDEPRRHTVGMLSGLDITYDFGEGHPVVGRRMPDLDLFTGDGPSRVYDFMHDGQPLLLSFTGGAADVPVRVVEAQCAEVWELPVIGEVDAPSAVLVRPDGHVAWAGSPDDPALSRVIEQWFGESQI